MARYELTPEFDSRGSFYRKAIVEVDDNGKKTLYSYDTKVAEITPDGELRLGGYYSTTTGRHINEFLQQNGFPKMTKAQIEKVAVTLRAHKITTRKTTTKKCASKNAQKMKGFYASAFGTDNRRVLRRGLKNANRVMTRRYKKML